MERLTARYIDEHAANVQTYKSFMRSLVYGALQHAKARFRPTGADQVYLRRKDRDQANGHSLHREFASRRRLASSASTLASSTDHGRGAPRQLL